MNIARAIEGGGESGSAALTPLKTCTKCGAAKGLDDFHRYHRGTHGRAHWCKPCSASSSSEWYAANRDKALEAGRTYRRTNPAAALLKRARARAAKDAIPFNIEIEDIVIPDYCPVLPYIVLKTNIGPGGRARFDSPSLDKIIPTLGYVKGNVRVISHRANLLKSDGTPEELALVAADAKTATETAQRAVSA